MNLHRPMVAALSVLVFAACGGDDPMGLDDPDPNVDTREILASPSFATDIQEILDRRGCTAAGCHGGGAGGLNLTASNAAANHATLVGMEANGEMIDYVIPNDANGSYIVMKLEGRQTVGQQMPRGGAALDNIDLTNIKNWINNGAPNN